MTQLIYKKNISDNEDLKDISILIGLMNLVRKNYWSEKNSCRKKVVVKKKLWSEKIHGRKNIFKVFFHYFIGGRLHLKHFYILLWSFKLKFKIWGNRNSGCWDIPFLIFEVFFHYFIGGRLHLKYFYSLTWSYKLRL